MYTKDDIVLSIKVYFMAPHARSRSINLVLIKPQGYFAASSLRQL